MPYSKHIAQKRSYGKQQPVSETTLTDARSLPAVPALQKAAAEEELQMKAEPVQKAGREEELQLKADPVQKAAPEEELQKKAMPLQKAAPEEELQMKKSPFQLKSVLQKAAPQEELQMKADPVQKAAPEEELQMKAAPVQKKENKTGMPDNLKSGVENLSGFSMDDVKVHYNSSQPAQLNALAYAQGTDIHIGPGQEKHLPHEAWHVAQQKQGRVQPTTQMKEGVPVNDDPGLEHEADVMGAKAMQQV